jgi:nonribosomal peptide synthetase DhbF
LLGDEQMRLRDVPTVFARLGLRLDRVPTDRWMDLARTRLAETRDESLAAILAILAKHDDRKAYPAITSEITQARLRAVDAAIGSVDQALLERYLANLDLGVSIHRSRPTPKCETRRLSA